MKHKSKQRIVCAVALLTIFANLLVITVSANTPEFLAAVGTYRPAPNNNAHYWVTLSAPNRVSGLVPLHGGHTYDTAFSHSFMSDLRFSVQNPDSLTNLHASYSRFVSYQHGSAQQVIAPYEFRAGYYSTAFPRQMRMRTTTTANLIYTMYRY
jgi:hypothetical protein